MMLLFNLLLLLFINVRTFVHAKTLPVLRFDDATSRQEQEQQQPASELENGFYRTAESRQRAFDEEARLRSSSDERRNLYHRYLEETMSMSMPSSAPSSAPIPMSRVVLETEVVDIVVAGFPECGGDILASSFAKHDLVAIPEKDECGIVSNGSDSDALKKLQGTLEDLVEGTYGIVADAHLGIQCSNAMYSHKSISRMQHHSPNARYVVGMAHPILTLQRQYNARVTDIYKRMLDESIPSLYEVLDMDMPWKEISLDATRYELFLMQFAKTYLNPTQMNDLMGHEGYDIAVQPNNFEIFVYDLEQLRDEDETRSSIFRQSLADFLELNDALPRFNIEVGDSIAFGETVDLCASQYDDVRARMIQQGADTARWLREEFLMSDSVRVANREHFISTIESWGEDPCHKLGMDVSVMKE